MASCSNFCSHKFFVQTLHGKNFNFGSLPVALRKVMISKFAAFDNYQLAKYNKEKSRLKNDKKHKVRVREVDREVVGEKSLLS